MIFSTDLNGTQYLLKHIKVYHILTEIEVSFILTLLE